MSKPFLDAIGNVLIAFTSRQALILRDPEKLAIGAGVSASWLGIHREKEHRCYA